MTFCIAPAKHKGIPIMEEKETIGAVVIDEISIKIGPIRIRSLCLSLRNRITFWKRKIESKGGYPFYVR